jgi:hypothetical protein
MGVEVVDQGQRLPTATGEAGGPSPDTRGAGNGTVRCAPSTEKQQRVKMPEKMSSDSGSHSPGEPPAQASWHTVRPARGVFPLEPTLPESTHFLLTHMKEAAE